MKAAGEVKYVSIIQCTTGRDPACANAEEVVVSLPDGSSSDQYCTEAKKKFSFLKLICAGAYTEPASVRVARAAQERSRANDKLTASTASQVKSYDICLEHPTLPICKK